MKKCVIFAVTLCTLIGLSACNNVVPNASMPPSSAPAASVPPAGQSGQQDVPFPSELIQIPMGTASSSGTFYIYCGGVASVVNANVGNVEVMLEATAGSGANINLLQSGEIDMMICETGMVFEKMSGIALEENEQQFENIRALTPCYINTYTIETLDPNIHTIQEFEGKKVGVGNYLSGAHLGTEKVFDALSIPAELVNSSWADGFTELADGRLDAMSGPTGHPSSPILELETKSTVNYVPLSDTDINTIMDKYGYNFSREVIPAGTYASMVNDYNTVGVWVCLFVRDDMDDDVAYHITKAIMENNQTMVATHSVAADSLPENIVKQSVPIHPGAIQYYQEIGVAVPDSLIP